MAQRTTLTAALGQDEDAPAVAKKPERASRAARGTAKPVPVARLRRTGSVRLTIDFDRELHRALKSWALNDGDDASIADVVRAAIEVLTTNQEYGAAVLERVDQLRRAHSSSSSSSGR